MHCKLLYIMLCFSFSISELNFPQISFAQDSKSYTLAVLDLEPNGVSQVESRGLSDKLRSHISQLIQDISVVKDHYELIERTQMDKIFGQFELQNTGCVSDSCAVEFGKMLQADRIVIGTVSLIGQTYSVIVRIVDVESGKTVLSADRQYKGAIDEVLVTIMPQIGNELIGGEKMVSPMPDVLQTELKTLVKMGISTVLEGIFGKDFYLVSIPGGSFEMGSNDNARDEKPVHMVSLDGFEMSSTEVTQKQYKIIVGENRSSFKGDENLPVENVSWYDAVKFCNKLSEIAGLDISYNESTWECDFSKNGFRLPTEAEWEYACRAGTKTNYYTGDGEVDLYRAGWYKKNSNSKTQPVKHKEPNSWGLYDLHGNVWEWCHDLYGKYDAEGLRNPVGAQKGSYRVIRGGSVKSGPGDGLSTNRHYNKPKFRYKFLGFRIARSIVLED